MSLTPVLGDLAAGLLAVVFPPHCAVCGEPAPRALCEACTCTALEAADETLAPPELDGAACVGAHAGPLREAILALKFHRRVVLAEPLGGLLAARLASLQTVWQVNLVAPVPSHPRRRRERGVDQTALLAAVLARQMGLQLEPRLLTRTRYTVPQVQLTPEERRQNLDREAFTAPEPVRVRGRRVLLIDDVTTTGATLAACAAALRAAGAEAVFALTLSHGG